MGLIAVNIIGLIMFILAIVMFVLADSMVGIAIGVAISVVWLTFTITANVHILKGRRSTEKLKDSARGHLFDAQIERLNRQYESIITRYPESCVVACHSKLSMLIFNNKVIQILR